MQVQIQNPKLHELYNEINGLSDEDQQARVILLDAAIRSSQVRHIPAGWEARKPDPSEEGPG